MDRIDSSLIALRRIVRATELFGREIRQATGVTPAQFRVLQIIAEQGFVTAKAISWRMQVSQGTVTSLVDKLVRDGLALREKSSQDRRQIHILLTDAARVVLAEAPDPLQQRFVRKFAAMDDWEQALRVAGLERVAAMLDAEGLDASPVLATGDIRPPTET
ncbi:MarR family winged helix-turn-helix transcriptional regulator [Pseudophaeobacter leonis]|uniref:MarR family winged helix-turn-helix transcriptional regulator n=1 Tax=Pseudophaeobacter leonis TaxID=1144477 RepID=UPI0009F3521A|nr:MarR family transcriptional regulator [Pseudophaeobacter leonis]